MYNLEESIIGFARACFNYGLNLGWPVYMSTKNTILKAYDGLFKDTFEKVYREEFSETVGFKIKGPTKSILFIPDIDKWGKWNQNLIEEIKTIDVALIDGTFYDSKEVNYRDISEIPHPFVVETVQMLNKEKDDEKSKIKFIHLIHTTPLLDSNSNAHKKVVANGFNIGKFKEIIPL